MVFESESKVWARNYGFLRLNLYQKLVSAYIWSEGGPKYLGDLESLGGGGGGGGRGGEGGPRTTLRTMIGIFDQDPYIYPSDLSEIAYSDWFNDI